MELVTQLVELVKKAKPFSCWCNDIGLQCPIKVPTQPTHKGLNISCGTERIHCCLERESDLGENAAVLNTISNMTNQKELSDLMISFLEILKPQNMYKHLNFNSQYSGAETEYDQLYEENDISRAQKYIDISINNDDEYTMYHFLFNTVRNVITLLIAPEKQHIERSSRNQTFEEKAAAIIVGFLNSTFFTTENRVKSPVKVDNKVKIENKVKNDQKVKTDNTINKLEPSPGKNNTKTALDKFDDPYVRLGWFSRAVETAIDGSVYVGSAIGAMYMVSMFLSGLINQVWTTCFMCYFSENFDLVPISDQIIT